MTTPRPRTRALLALLAGVLITSLVGLPVPPAGADQNESATNRVAAASITAGTDHTCALLVSGAVRCWGGNTNGQLGLGNTNALGDNEAITSAATVPLGEKATAISAGAHHTCALLVSGAVRCWGANDAGQLGLGNTNALGDNEAVTTAPVLSLGARAIAISAGAAHTCALLVTGAVRCWGANSDGELGLGSTSNIGDNEAVTAAPPVPLGGAAVAVSAGDGFTCAVLGTGAVRCWGVNASGQLGLGNTATLGDNEAITTASAVPLGAAATAVTAGGAHTCALLAGGSVRCWGENANGQLGLGSTDDLGDDEPVTSVAAVSLGASVTGIAAGGAHTCARLADGTVRCWGANASGQLGLGTTNDLGDNEAVTSASLIPLGAGASAVTTGANHTCAVLTNGALRCWGENLSGQLGLGTTDDLGDNEAVTSAAAVATGEAVRVRGADTQRVKAKKYRDRSRPYTFRLRGKLRGAFVSDSATCTGTVRIVAKLKGHPGVRITRYATLRDGHAACKYERKVKVHRKGSYRIVATLPTTENLTRSRDRIHVRAG